jgi:hypothetical protein
VSNIINEGGLAEVIRNQALVPIERIEGTLGQVFVVAFSIEGGQDFWFISNNPALYSRATRLVLS